MKNPSLVLFAIACLSLASSSAPVSAQTISYTGVDLDLGPSWRDATVTKAFATTPQNIYGSDGYMLAGLPGTYTVLPSYVSSVNTLVQSGSYTYASIDNPIATSPYFSGTVTSGTAYNNGSAAGSTIALLNFTLTGTVPNDIRVGVLFDNTDNSIAIGGNEGLSLVQTSGGSATSGVITTSAGNQVPDYYFFDIVGATAGDTFTLNATNLTANPLNLEAGGFTFDTVATVTPEPSTYAMLGAGFAVLLIVLRKRALRAA